MCGRFEFIMREKVLKDYFQIENDDYVFEEREEIFPTQNCLVVLKDYELTRLKWGLAENWAKRPLINTRLETADKKRTSAEAFHNQRCVIPCSAFYEWDEAKQKFWIGIKDQEIFGMAGIYKLYETDDGDQYGAFSILTNESTREMAAIHPRMPVILNAAQTDDYLHDQRNLATLKGHLLRISPRFVMKAI